MYRLIQEFLNLKVEIEGRIEDVTAHGGIGVIAAEKVADGRLGGRGRDRDGGENKRPDKRKRGQREVEGFRKRKNQLKLFSRC